ncbi:MAG: hypothetical protein EZS28_042274, partial [Streblomastix strix]
GERDNQDKGGSTNGEAGYIDYQYVEDTDEIGIEDYDKDQDYEEGRSINLLGDYGLGDIDAVIDEDCNATRGGIYIASVYFLTGGGGATFFLSTPLINSYPSISGSLSGNTQ